MYMAYYLSPWLLLLLSMPGLDQPLLLLRPSPDLSLIHTLHTQEALWVLPPPHTAARHAVCQDRALGFLFLAVRSLIELVSINPIDHAHVHIHTYAPSSLILYTAIHSAI